MGVTVVPDVSAEQRGRGVAEPDRAVVASGVMLLDGSDPSFAWGNTAGTRQPGIVPGDRLPVLWRDDYVQNSNDSAWLSNPEAPLTGYPAIVSEEGVVQGGRTRMGIAQIEARLAGPHGRPRPTLHAATLPEHEPSNPRVF